MNKVISILFAIGLVGCGGGGGNQSPSPETPNPPATSPTPTNPDPLETSPPHVTANPDYHLGTDRFTIYQPKVLEQIGAHHAYAKGLTGKSVKIGIQDTIVDYTQTAEFGSRVKLSDADGAVLVYQRPLGSRTADIQACQIVETCRIWRVNSEGDPENINDGVQKIVIENGWPILDDSVFMEDEYYSSGSPFRWWEVPTPYDDDGFHGTAVASTAAGNNLGVAPGSTIIPIAHNLSNDLADFDNTLLPEIDFYYGQRDYIVSLSDESRMALDDALSNYQSGYFANFDIINRSYGDDIYDGTYIFDDLDAERQWFLTYMPKWWNAMLQADRPDANKTIIVNAAGNNSADWSGLGGDLPYYIPELRGHTLAVAATDPATGNIAEYSDRCGSIPDDWNSALFGPHYCLSAPGTVRGLVPNSDTPGKGDIYSDIQGTSFAAPIVSGALALMMEHFRGVRGNTEIVKRMLDTADRTGEYAKLEIYGAGLLDLEAALSPVGTLTVGQKIQSLNHSTLQTPAAFGSITDRLSGLELTAFDAQNFPFWFPLTTVVSTRETVRSHIPVLRVTSSSFSVTAPDIYGLTWMPTANVKSLWLNDEDGWIFGFGPNSASLARSPHSGGWGYGFSLENSGYMGAEASGAFGSNVDSSVVWSSRSFQHRFSGGLKLDAVGTLAVSMPQYDKNAIFQASSSILSSASMRMGTDSTGLVIEQPLRAESGTGIFRVENGMIENGKRLYDEHRISLQPARRETRVTFRHDRELQEGKFAFQVSSAFNAGHASGKRDSSVGMGYWKNL